MGSGFIEEIQKNEKELERKRQRALRMIEAKNKKNLLEKKGKTSIPRSPSVPISLKELFKMNNKLLHDVLNGKKLKEKVVTFTNNIIQEDDLKKNEEEFENIESSVNMNKSELTINNSSLVIKYKNKNEVLNRIDVLMNEVYIYFLIF
jgi:hypothetical protein